MTFEKDLKFPNLGDGHPPFPGWEQYPANLSRDPLSFDCSYYDTRIAELRSAVFSSNPKDCSADIIDVSVGDVIQTSFLDNQTLENYLLEAPEPEIRIILLCSENSITPLQISEETMLKLLTHHDVGPEFLDMAFSFGHKPRDSEVGLGSMTMIQRADAAYDICYLINYVEPSQHGVKTSWPVRQTGVFHRFNPQSGSGLWIFINPMPNSKMQQRLLSLVNRQSTEWHQLDLLVISSYINNWRWYLNDLHDQFEDTVDMALTLDFSQTSDLPLGLETLSKLQHLQDKILPLSARFEASQMTIRSLQQTNTTFHEKKYYDDANFKHISNELGLYARKFQGHLISTEVLKSRAQGILKLLAVTLDLKNQMTSVDINNNMLSLTKDTVDDSTTVRVVTVVTLLYLPASFVATLFGMNLFTFQTHDGSGFQVSQQFWIYIALSVPLTIITIGSWFLFAKNRKDDKGKRSRTKRSKIEPCIRSSDMV